MPTSSSNPLSRAFGFVRKVWNAPASMRNRIDALKLDLERIEDKLIRIENGLEAAGVLTKESRLNQRNLDPQKLSLEESFEYIYRHRLWAGETTMYSGSGSYGTWAEQFVELVKQFVREHDIRTITDIGCGDFNVGSQLCPLVEHYHALDISREIIRINTERFSKLPTVTFRQANACVDSLPRADLAIIRQVLQHLTNAQVEAILKNVEQTGFRFILVAEHQPAEGKPAKPNLDLEAQGERIRFDFDSGVYLDQPPFSRPVSRIASFEGEGGQLAIYLWDLAPRAPAPVA